jgi:hypothetical protein
MKKVIRLTEGDLVRIVKRIVSEQINIPQEELSKNNIADDVRYRLDEYKNYMDDFLSELQSVDKRRFMSRIKNGTNQIYQELVNSLDGPKDPRMSMLDKTFAHKQQELYGYFLDKLK